MFLGWSVLFVVFEIGILLLLLLLFGLGCCCSGCCCCCWNLEVVVVGMFFLLLLKSECCYVDVGIGVLLLEMLISRLGLLWMVLRL